MRQRKKDDDWEKGRSNRYGGRKAEILSGGKKQGQIKNEGEVRLAKNKNKTLRERETLCLFRR